jgi:hypothetical protein
MQVILKAGEPLVVVVVHPSVNGIGVAGAEQAVACHGIG